MVITKKCTFAGYLLLSNKTTRHGLCFSFPYSLKQQQYMELFPASHRSFPSSPTTMRWFRLSLDKLTLETYHRNRQRGTGQAHVENCPGTERRGARGSISREKL